MLLKKIFSLVLLVSFFGCAPYNPFKHYEKTFELPVDLVNGTTYSGPADLSIYSRGENAYLDSIGPYDIILDDPKNYSDEQMARLDAWLYNVRIKNDHIFKNFRGTLKIVLSLRDSIVFEKLVEGVTYSPQGRGILVGSMMLPSSLEEELGNLKMDLELKSHDDVLNAKLKDPILKIWYQRYSGK